mgnify:CR=1 FL=1|jgi:hypothetical protein
MKVKIGNYRKNKGKKVDVSIERYDIGDMDATLAHIIYPMLVKLKKHKHGAPNVDDEDVPEELRSYNSDILDSTANGIDEIDANHFKRWDWVMDEMIWGFGQYNSDWEDQFMTKKEPADIIPEPRTATLDGMGLNEWSFDSEGRRAHEDRIVNATTLFGKYYSCLWS